MGAGDSRGVQKTLPGYAYSGGASAETDQRRPPRTLTPPDAVSDCRAGSHQAESSWSRELPWWTSSVLPASARASRGVPSPAFADVVAATDQDEPVEFAIAQRVACLADEVLTLSRPRASGQVLVQAKDDTVHPRRFTLLSLVATLDSALAGTNITSVVVRSLVLTPASPPWRVRPSWWRRRRC